MKNLLKFAFALFLSLSFFACSNEDSEQTNEELSTIEEILVEMKAMATEENKVVKFDVTYVDGLYKSEVTELVDVFEYQFQNGYSNRMSGGVTVECSDGTTTNCSGENEGSCVGAAVKACLDKGECANVCPASISIAP